MSSSRRHSSFPPWLPTPTWLGRPFVKILAKGDPVPGTPGATFGHIEHFTLRDGTLHIVAGENSSRVGLFRWRDGVLTKLVYTDTVAPTGGTFDVVHFTTDETEGALNFSAEVAFNRPGAINGFFEWRNGVITTIFDGTKVVDGKVLMGLGYPVRVGHEVAGGTLFTENVLLAMDPVSGVETKLDDQSWQVLRIDGQGDDVAALTYLRTATGYGKPAIYAVIGSTTTPPPAPVLSIPAAAHGSVRFRFASQPGKTYRVEFLPALPGLG